ncbi:MAG: hypothetical protein EOP84_02440 [Verrucomicrobiaceae bacterium]|nr:MAG: hypothetical protein EOP84_02440 [Verrucomicrobiaceae bacterium]
MDTILESHLPGSSSQPGKPEFLTELQFGRIYFDTVSLKRRLIWRLFPEATAKIPSILAELDAQGVLFRDFHKAAAASKRTRTPVWVAARAEFSTPQFIREDWPVPVNEVRSILFLSGPLAKEYYDYSDSYFRNSQAYGFPPLEMRASLFWIPEVWGYGANRADKPSCLNRGEPRQFWVFGAMAALSGHFEIKPYAIRAEQQQK